MGSIYCSGLLVCARPKQSQALHCCTACLHAGKCSSSCCPALLSYLEVAVTVLAPIGYLIMRALAVAYSEEAALGKATADAYWAVWQAIDMAFKIAMYILVTKAICQPAKLKNWLRGLGLLPMEAKKMEAVVVQKR